jgi:hypothetical protein
MTTQTVLAADPTTTRTGNMSPLILARAAGFLYLLVVPLGIFGMLVSSRLIVPGNAAATASNIMASESLFRLSIVSDLLASLTMLVVSLVLYRLLEPVDHNMAMAMVILALVGTSIAMLNKLNHLAALQLLSGSGYLTVFTTEELQALAYLFLRLHSSGGDIAFIFWGLWLFPLGYLVFKSGFLPRILGILLMIACLSYVISSFSAFLGYTVNIGIFAAMGEILFILWLLIKGVNVQKWQDRLAQSV